MRSRNLSSGHLSHWLHARPALRRVCPSKISPFRLYIFSLSRRGGTRCTCNFQRREICSFAAHKLLFSFKRKKCNCAPFARSLLRLSTNPAPVFSHQYPSEGVCLNFLMVLFILNDVWPRKTMSFQGSAPTGLPPITLPSVIYSRHIKWLPNQPHSSSNYALTDRVAHQNEG